MSSTADNRGVDLADAATTALPARVSRAFGFVALCCRWPHSDALLATIRRTATAIDAPHAARIAARHRVQGLVHNALGEACVAWSPEVTASLASDAARIAMRGLLLAAETQRLVAMATSAGLNVVILKGTPLAQLAYGTVTLKHGADIDLAVALADLVAMRAVLLAAQYRALPACVAKDEPWHHPKRGILVELHTELVDHPAWLAGVDVASATQMVPIGAGHALPTLAPDTLFAYLCVHGAGHGWSRLKWLADLAALIAPLSPAEVARLHDHAQTLGAGRCAAQALILCAELFDTRLDPAHQARLRRDPVDRLLVHNGYRSFRGSSEVDELDTRPLGTLRIHLAQFVFTRGWRARLDLLRRKLQAPPAVDGPHRTHGWPIRVIRWLRGRFRRSAALRRADTSPR